MSMFDLLNIGTRGLAAAQSQLDLVGQNVTNANTEGYSRKRANLQAGARQDGVYGEVGFGVDVVNIKSMRDSLLNRQMQEVATTLGEREQLDKELLSVENVLTEPSDSGLNKFLDKFWSSWQDLANNPADVTARQAVLDASSSLVGRFQDIGNQFNQLIAAKNEEISSYTGQINQLLEGIAKDNQTISESEMGGERTTANDTRDQRELKLNALSRMLEISYTEDAQGRYVITAAGSLLVSTEGALPLKVERSQFSLADGSQVSRSTVTLSSTGQELEPAGGSLKSLFVTRDDIIPRYQNQIDEYAKRLVQSVNAQHSQGYDLAGSTGTNFFDPATTGASTIDLSATVKNGTAFLAAAFGGTSQGLGAPLDLTIPAAGEPLDIGNTVNTNYRNFSANSVIVRTVGPPSVLLKEGAGNDYTVDYRGGRIMFNNSAASMTAPGTDITVDFRYTSAAYNGQGDGNNALKIAQLAQTKIAAPDQFGNYTATLGDAYSSLVGKLGAEKSNSASTLTTATNLKDYLQKQIDSISGVSMDEELGNMVKFQNSYSASARYINTVSRLMDTLIGLGQ
ncbi:MAG: hypothetical protein RL173_3235 [Fibrobacterota bacterium]|jgi:flagellar hook-associated protein 1 FlgK